jgi:hypothetical protein
MTLHGIQIAFRYIRYDWSEVEGLKHGAQTQKRMVICSSEGGLLEYGSDEQIVANLKVLRSVPETLAVVGSGTRADEPIQRLHQTSNAATRPRGLDVFRPLVQKVG